MTTAHDMGATTAIGERIAKVEGKYNLLEQRTGSSLHNLSSSVSAMQGDMREQSRLTHEIKNELAGMRAQSEGLERLGSRLERYIESHDTEMSRHLAENKLTADAVTGFQGAIRALAWAFGLVVLLSGAVITLQFDNVQAKFGDAANARGKLENRIERLEARP